MEIPSCFTQLFVDKQNVRSYGNIVKRSLLKEENHYQFLQNIFEDTKLVSCLSPDIKQILYTLRTNLRNNCKKDFKTYFSVKEEDHNLISINKLEIFKNCWCALSDIIPKNLFGNKYNEELFKKIVQIIIYGMKWQHLQFEKYIRKWDLSIHPWKDLNEPESITILYYVLLWIIQNILSAMVCLNFHVTTTKLDYDENKLQFFCKHRWQSFYDITLNKMIQKGIITKVDLCSMGKKVKRNHSLEKRLRLRNLKKEIPKLHLILKVNNDSRPIIRYKSYAQTLIEKQNIKRRLIFLRLLIGESQPKMETLFNSVYLKWLQLSKPKLYFIKTDLSNAFGSVDKGNLLRIMQERFLNYQINEKSAQSLERATNLFKEIFSEVRKHFLIRAGSTTYVWKKGLIQGYKYSPALSELYYKHLDEIYFSEHLKPPNENAIKLFTRVVDDYFYVTDSLEDANKFLIAITNYKNVNYDKTVVNFPHPDIKYSDEITFLGYCYKTSEMQVSRDQNVFNGLMCYKISFSRSIDNIYKFLESRIGQSSMQINGHIFNLLYNKESLVWEHVFTTFCLSANKFCTILAVLCDDADMPKFVQLYKRKVTVKLGNTIIETLMKNKPNGIQFVYCINHFRYLSLLALSMCAKKTPKCTKIVCLIQDELSKSNCIFGKWKEHASRIDCNGNKLCAATRDICRRSDLRVVMRKFDTLPEGFKCYNHKLICMN